MKSSLRQHMFTMFNLMILIGLTINGYYASLPNQDGKPLIRLWGEVLMALAVSKVLLHC